MAPWTDLHQQINWARETLSSAVIGDILDKLGYPHQFLPMDLRPVSHEMVLAGIAMTVLGRDLSSEESSPTHHPYGLLFQALDDLKQNEVFVYAGGTPNYAIWGGLMSTRAIQLQAAGALIDGCYRDTKEIVNLQFPTFGKAAYGPDQKSRGIITAYRCPIMIGKVSIEDGDFIFGDVDGVVVIPQELNNSVLQAAWDKLQEENKLKKALEYGMSSQEAFDQYGIF